MKIRVFLLLQPELDKIASIKFLKEDLFETTALLQNEGVGVMFGVFIDQDMKNSEKYAMYLWQGGLGLPNREYYYSDDDRTKNIRNEYKIHIANTLELLGEDQSRADADNNVIYKIEYFLADSWRKLEDLRDPYANYNKMS